MYCMSTIKCKNNYGNIVELPADKFKSRPSAYAFLVRKGLILTCKNKSNGKLWFPGGGIEGNETPEQALRRECAEETGITDVTIIKPLAVLQNYFYYEPTDEAMDAQLHFFLCETKSENVKPNSEIDDDEAFDFNWLKIDQISPEDIGDLHKEIYDILTSLT